MRLNFIALSIGLSFLGSHAQGQDTLLFINGKEVPAMGIRLDPVEDRLHFLPLTSKKMEVDTSRWFILDGFGLIQKEEILPGKLLEANDSLVRFLEKGSDKPKSYPLKDVLAAWEGGLALRGTAHKRGYVHPAKEKTPLPQWQKAKKERDVWVFRIFSHYQGAQETVVYRQDTASRDFFLEESEARAYIYGRRSARRHYESVFSYVGGGIVGASAAGLNYFWAPGPAILFLVVNTSIPVKNIKTGPEDAAWKDNPLFVDGYKVQASKRKLRNGLLVAAPAVVAGILVRYFYIQ